MSTGTRRPNADRLLEGKGRADRRRGQALYQGTHDLNVMPVRCVTMYTAGEALDRDNATAFNCCYTASPSTTRAFSERSTC